MKGQARLVLCFQFGKKERDATGRTMLVAQLTIHAWREMVIVTTMTTALVPWFVATTTVLGMDLMALMIAVQHQERQVLHMQTSLHVVSECSPCTITPIGLVSYPVKTFSSLLVALDQTIASKLMLTGISSMETSTQSFQA